MGEENKKKMDIGKGNIRVVPIAMTAILTLSLLSGLGIFVVTNVAIAKTFSEMATNQIAESNLNIACEASYAAEFPELNISISKQELLIEDYTVPITRGCDFKWYGDGVWSEYPEYEPYNDFIDYTRFANYADGCNYTAYFYEYAPDGTLIWTDSRFDWLPGGYYVTWTITVHSPTAGWEIGDFKFCSEVMPDDCGALPVKCCNNTVILGGVQDINVTPEHLDFECCEEVYSLNASITLKNSSDIRCTHNAYISNLNETNHIIGNVSNNLSEPEIPLCGCNKAEGEVIGIKNPAAVYCMDMGYEYKIEKTESGERGICVMPDKEECDAWAFYRGECGRVFSYCAKKGWPIALKGKADCFATTSTTCVLPDGTRKTVSELLNISEKCTVGVQKPSGTNLNNGNIECRDTDLPDHFNWRDKDGSDWMTPVKNQGSCGSCWAFSAVGVVEPQYNIFMKNPDLDLDLSEEYLVSDCYNAGSCCGGWHYEAINFTKDSGIPDEACLPYVDGTGCSCYGDTCDSNCNYRTGGACSDTTCSDRCSNWSTRLKYINETGSVPNDIETIKVYLIEKGPLSVAIGMGQDFGGSFDGNGIYRCSDDNDVNHAVVITGYNETDDYWIVKNSWGSGWIDEGYFKVGYGECAIETMVYYANHTAGVNCKTLTVFNEGDGNLVVDNIEILYQSGEPTGWLDADPKSFMVSSGGTKRVSVCVNCTGLSPGEYHGWLNITSNDPDEDPYAVTVTLTDKPESEACFLGSPTEGCEPLTVEFNASCSTGEITNYSWDFGDEETGSGMAISHTYEAAGDYTVNLTVAGPCGSDTETNYIHVYPKEEPDLIITDTWVCGLENCTICYNVTNVGNGTAPAGHNTTLFVDSIEAASDLVALALVPNESYTGCFDDYNWTYTPPDDNITVCADSNNTVAESNETNNCMINTWKCGDVDENGIVNIMDMRLLMMHVADPTGYPVESWAGDVDGDGDIDGDDVQLLLAQVFAPEAHPLNCRGG